MQKLLNNYKTYLQKEQKSVNTIQMYLQEADRFLKFVTFFENSLKNINEQHVIKYRNQLLKDGKKVSTINKSISTLSSFFTWACQEGYFQRNFAKNIRMYQFSNFKRPRLLKDEVILLTNEISKEQNLLKRVRNLALLTILLNAGLRVQEVTDLKIDDVCYKKKCIKIQNNEYSREVYLTEKDMEWLIKWILVRKTLNKKIYIDSPYFFVTERSGQMHPRAIQYLFKKYSDRLGFLVNAQILRNTYCYHQVEKGLNPQQLQKVAGHRSIQTSYQFYLK